jgi:LysR family transcriptional regulator, glycine cleavage system transcriptional activator
MPTRPPSLRAIAAFEAAARHQSFAKAAQELNLSHGAVSHAIRGLEDRLATQLFIRQGRGVALSEPGRVFAGRVRLSLGLLSQAFDTMPWVNRSKLVVTLHPAFAGRILAPRIAGFQAAQPGIDLELRASGMLEPVGEGEIDVGIRYGPGGWSGLSSARLFDETWFPVISPAYPAPPPRTPKELLEHPLLGHPEIPWRPWFAAAGLDHDEPRAVITTDESGLLLDLAASGVGIGLVRSVLAAPDIAAGRLLKLFEIEVPANYGYWLVWNPASPKLAAIEAFYGWLAQAIVPSVLAIGEKPSP